MTACKDCGDPVDGTHTHHVDEQRGNNDPDNLSDRCPRCHMAHHDNDRATDHRSTGKYGPQTASVGAASPTTGPPTP
jgi:hypothetical protein